jgi:hypothetical protein
MNTELKQPLYKVYCSRDIIFKKYNRQISELVRLDFNIDLLPTEKGKIYCDKTGNKSTDILYIDMSSNEFTVYNEDLKKCGHYDYNTEYIKYYHLPLKNKVNLCKKSCEKASQIKQDYDEDEALKLAIAESLKHYKENDEPKSSPPAKVAVAKSSIWENSYITLDESLKHNKESDKLQYEEEPPPKKVVVTRIEISGEKYLKSKDNILYNPETKEEVGLWDPQTKTIKELPEEDDEDNNEEDDETNELLTEKHFYDIKDWEYVKPFSFRIIPKKPDKYGVVLNYINTNNNEIIYIEEDDGKFLTQNLLEIGWPIHKDRPSNLTEYVITRIGWPIFMDIKHKYVDIDKVELNLFVGNIPTQTGDRVFEWPLFWNGTISISGETEPFNVENTLILTEPVGKLEVTSKKKLIVDINDYDFLDCENILKYAIINNTYQLDFGENYKLIISDIETNFLDKFKEFKKKEEPKKVEVTRIEISGEKYLKSKDSIIYNPDTQEKIGIWDEKTKTIKEVPDEEDDYDEDEALKLAIAESLKYDNNNKYVPINKNQNLMHKKAIERLEAYKNKNKPKSKNNTSSVEFQNEKIRKLWN